MVLWPRVCTYDTICVHGEEPTGLDEAPGQRYDIDEQCALLTENPDSKAEDCVSIDTNKMWKGMYKMANTSTPT